MVILLLRLSKSKLLDFRVCPRKFYFKYVTVLGNKNEEDKPSYVFNGSLLHEFFEAFNKNDPSFPYYQKSLMADIDLKNHVLGFYQILQKHDLQRAYRSEIKLYDEDLDLVGVIDAIYEKDGEYWIVDYKTGKFRKEKMDEYKFELYLYVILVEKMLCIEVNKIGMFFSSAPDNSFVIETNKKEKEEALAEYMKEREIIENGQFDRMKGRLCPYCDFIAICDGYRDDIICD